MNARLKELLDRAAGWPEQAQFDLLQAGLEIEAEQGAYRATAGELRSIDEALKQVKRGELASAEEVEAAFAKFRRA
ncbi:MAG: hypothetical protein H0T75_13360 [Rhizobiales bacterium]|jgi:hypothetical protein|nr:hypothetical protein [Hyphomicrobiales bacterium]MDQ3561194.1 hypothetical protein [Pseudomonadota bacterium]